MASEFVESSCACEVCKDMCRRRPCWPKPQEAQALIDKGFGARLMLDWWVGDGKDGGNIYLISPAIKGYEECRAPANPVGQCTFLKKNCLCELHSLGLKPFEGRVAHHKIDSDGDHWAVANFWNNIKGQKLAHEWEDKFSPKDSESEDTADNNPIDAILSSFMRSY